MNVTANDLDLTLVRI